MGRLKEGVGEAVVVVAAVGRVLGGKWGGCYLPQLSR